MYDIISLFAVELEEPKIGISDKGLTSQYDLSIIITIRQFIPVGAVGIVCIDIQSLSICVNLHC